MSKRKIYFIPVSRASGTPYTWLKSATETEAWEKLFKNVAGDNVILDDFKARFTIQQYRIKLMPILEKIES